MADSTGGNDAGPVVAPRDSVGCFRCIGVIGRRRVRGVVLDSQGPKATTLIAALRDTIVLPLCRTRDGLQMRSNQQGPDLTFRMAHALVAVVLAATGTVSVYAEGFDPLSSPDQLEGSAVVNAGNIRAMSGLNAPALNQLGTPRSKFYELGLYCFQPVSDDDLEAKAGLLVLDRFGNTSVAVLSEIVSTVKVTSYPVTVYDCTALMQQQLRRSTDDLKRRMETLKRQQEALDKLRRSLKQGSQTSGTP